MKLTERKTITIIIVLVLVTVIARALPGPRTIDDAFITFRYSRNIVEGQGFVYNVGVRTMGTTTPLYTLLMATISLVTGQQDFPSYAIVVNTIADCITSTLLFLITVRATKSTLFGFVLGFLWAISPGSVRYAVAGMETSVNILWMMAAFWCYITDSNDAKSVSRFKDKRIWIGVFAALGLLTRIDSALWVALLFVHQWFDHVRKLRVVSPSTNTRTSPLSYLPLTTWIPCTVLMLPWLIFSTLYFGSPIPNSLLAKSVAYHMPAGTAFTQLGLNHFAVPFFESRLFVGTGQLGSIIVLLLMVIYLTNMFFGILYATHKLPRLVPFLIYPWLYLLVFSTANPFIFPWYAQPPMPAVMLALACGFWSIISRIDLKVKRFAPITVSIFGIFWTISSFNMWTLHPDHGLDRPAPVTSQYRIELNYHQFAEQLLAEYAVTPETRIAVGDIGVIGYFTRATIIDYVGLVTPEMRRYYPIPAEAFGEGEFYVFPPQIIADTQPDFFIITATLVSRDLAQDASFTENYILLMEIPTPYYWEAMQVYGRREDAQP